MGRHLQAADAGVLGRHLINDGAGAVLTAVVDDDDLDAVGRVIKRTEVFQRASDHPGLVARWHQDRDRRPLQSGGKSRGYPGTAPAVKVAGDKQQQLVGDHEPQDGSRCHEQSIKPTR